jgi:hypothetical protein
MLENSAILLVRHGEKPGDPCSADTKGIVDLSPLGQERAARYVQYFDTYVATTVDGTESEPIRLDYLFAAANTNSSHRPVETLTPLANASGLPFDTDISDNSFPDLVTLLQDQEYAGASILVCWHHGKIMALAKALLTVNGQPLPNLPPGSTWPGTYDCCVFGWVLQIRYDAHGIVMPDWTRCFNEHLMPDDTIDPPGALATMQHQGV